MALQEIKIIDIVNKPKESDEVLYATYLNDRDKEVLGVIFKRHMSLVYGVAMKHLAEKNAAQDATMEVFEKLIDFAPQNEINNFKGYLFVMTRNHCLMKIRGEQIVTVEITDRDVELATEMHPIDLEKGKSKEELLAKCLKMLKDHQKLCIEAFYFGKKSYSDISVESRLDISSVKSHIQNGKRNLKNCIEAQ